MKKAEAKSIASMEAVRQFVDHLRIRNVRTYKGEVPLPDGTRVAIDVTFERERMERPAREPAMME